MRPINRYCRATSRSRANHPRASSAPTAAPICRSARIFAGGQTISEAFLLSDMSHQFNGREAVMNARRGEPQAIRAVPTCLVGTPQGAFGFYHIDVYQGQATERTPQSPRRSMCL